MQFGVSGILVMRSQFGVDIERIQSGSLGTADICIPVISDHEAMFAVKLMLAYQRFEESTVRLPAHMV